MTKKSAAQILIAVTFVVLTALFTNCAPGFTTANFTNGSEGANTAPTEWDNVAAVLKASRCVGCHGTPPGSGGVYLFDSQSLIDNGLVIAGDPGNSLFYLNTDGSHQNVPSLSASERQTIATWIVSLAAPTPAPTAVPAPTSTPSPPPGATPTPSPIPPLTNAQFFVAKSGPNGKSVNDLISVNRCANCHNPGGSTYDPNAVKYLTLLPNDAAGNYSRLGAVKLPDGTTRDLRSVKAAAAVNKTIYQFAAGHKAKNPAYNAAELQHILNFVNTP